MSRAFEIEPVAVKSIQTAFRRIMTRIPAPDSVEVLETLRQFEPQAMAGQPPIVWNRAEGFQVYDGYGNMWLDWSSGVLVANVGHNPREITEAILQQVDKGLLHNYCFPSAERAEVVRYLVQITPPELKKAFLLTTGSEAVENSIKLALTYGQKLGYREKTGLISFERAFHGRTLGAQLVGGIPSQKNWIGGSWPNTYQVPFPDGFRTEDTCFDLFLETLQEEHVSPENVAAVITESYQGGGASFFPKEYVQRLATWCKENRVLLVFDEIQAGFGRTGKLFGFEHYEVVPDLVCLGKGITSSLPLSAVVGSAEVMDLYAPNEMTSTHSGNPVCLACALASMRKIVQGGVVENARAMGDVLFTGLDAIAEQYRSVIGAVHGRGLVAGLHMVRAGAKEPDGDLAQMIVEKAFQKGLLLLAPVGMGGATIKICPPLTITEEAIKEGIVVLADAVGEAVRQLERD